AGVKLVAVGIGTAESAREFAEQVGLNVEQVFADEDPQMASTCISPSCLARASLSPGRSPSVVSKVRLARATILCAPPANTATNDDLESVYKIYKPLMPAGEDATDKTMVQGGTLAFDGRRQLFEHRDSSVGVHAELERVLSAVLA
ncbi:unnamed protein product, partial [Prorocentrum cordatum]